MILAPILEQHGVNIEARSGPKKQILFDRFLINFGPFWLPKTTTGFIAETPLSRTKVALRPGLGDSGPILALLSRFWPPFGGFGTHCWPHLGLLVPILVTCWPFWDPLLGIPGTCLMPFWDPVRAFRTAFSARLWGPKRKQHRTPKDTSHGLGTVADTAAAAAPGLQGRKPRGMRWI